jgi:hypothetical protein
MSLSEKLKTRTLNHGFTNSIDRWLATLEPAERDAALLMLRDVSWSQREVRWSFRDEGFPVSAATISEWRKFNGVTS